MAEPSNEMDTADAHSTSVEASHQDIDMIEGANGHAEAATQTSSVHVTKPIPYTFDLGNLLCTDPNPVATSSPTNDLLQSTARDCAQVLVNQLLSTVPITPSGDGGMALTLPPPTTPIPREKSIPATKPPTKWEQFAARKGIAPKRKEAKGKMVFDDASGEWVPRYGYKGKNQRSEESDWLVEVDEKKEARTAEPHDARSDGRAIRKEKAKRNERKTRANERRATKGAR